MELYYLIYTSTPARKLSDPELLQLLEVSREANKQYQVTGMLVCLPESYIQLIEGPQLHIQQLYGNIQRDARHLRVTTLREGIIARRFFPDWSMAFRKQDNRASSYENLSLEHDNVIHLFDILDGQ